LHGAFNRISLQPSRGEGHAAPLASWYIAAGLLNGIGIDQGSFLQHPEKQEAPIR
jgi:hypothetical protein